MKNTEWGWMLLLGVVVLGSMLLGGCASMDREAWCASQSESIRVGGVCDV